MSNASVFELDRYEEALPYLKKAVEYFPADQFSFTNLGLSLLKLGQADEGLATLAQAHNNRPQNKWTAARYCAALFSQQQCERALAELPNEIVAHGIKLWIELFICCYCLDKSSLPAKACEIGNYAPDME